jgi:hypothetical protein
MDQRTQVREVQTVRICELGSEQVELHRQTTQQVNQLQPWLLVVHLAPLVLLTPYYLGDRERPVRSSTLEPNAM